MVDRENMSIEEMLALCRGGDAASTPAEPVADAPAAEAEPAAPAEAPVEESPAAAPPAEKKDPAAMSVADMLAAARGSGSAAAAPKKPAAKAAAPKPKPAAAKPAATESVAEPSGPMTTASILAAARGESASGPVSKAVAREQGQSTGAKPAKEKLVVPPMPAKPAYAQPVETAAP